MPIWTPPPTDQQPEVILIGARLFEVTWATGATTRHAVGYNVLDCEGRVSSALGEIKDGIVVSESGRVYSLSTKPMSPDQSGDAEWVLAAWLRLSKLKAQDLRFVDFPE